MESLKVKRINRTGVLAKHNAENPESAIHIHDVITSVNGVEGDWRRMLAEFESGENVSMVVERSSDQAGKDLTTARSEFSLGEPLQATLLPGEVENSRRWTISLPKAKGQKIGARMKKNYQHAGEMVMEVRVMHDGGMLAEHNQRNPDAAVELGDMSFR
jgi:hypothetical protein